MTDWTFLFLLAAVLVVTVALGIYAVKVQPSKDEFERKDWPPT